MSAEHSAVTDQDIEERALNASSMQEGLEMYAAADPKGFMQDFNNIKAALAWKHETKEVEKQMSKSKYIACVYNMKTQKTEYFDVEEYLRFKGGNNPQNDLQTYIADYYVWDKKILICNVLAYWGESAIDSLIKLLQVCERDNIYGFGKLSEAIKRLSDSDDPDNLLKVFLFLDNYVPVRYISQLGELFY